MKLHAVGFDWDSGNKPKCRNYGLALKEIEDFFTQSGLFVMPDIHHSQVEERYIAYRPSPKGRPISARYMHKKEIKEYEEKSTEI